MVRRKPAGHNEVWNYAGCAQQESNPRLKALWERFLDYELGHLQLARQLFQDVERRDPAEVLGDGILPPGIRYESQREYVRRVLADEVSLRKNGTRFDAGHAKVSRRQRLSAYWKGLGTILGQIKSGETMLIPPPDAVPVTRFNTLVEPSRSFATTTLSLTLVAEIARATRSTINDVISALVGTAMRRYLNAKGETPAKSLYATMPISIHTDEDMDQSNRICFCAYSLATDAASPREQIESIRQSTAKAKAQIRSVPQSVLYSLMGVGILSLMVKRLRGGHRAVNPRIMTNVLISNVPLFKEARYYKGAKLLGLYPLSLVMDGIGINITVSSYIDRLLFGLVSDKTKAPDIEKIGQYMQDALEEMQVTLLGARVRQEA